MSSFPDLFDASFRLFLEEIDVMRFRTKIGLLATAALLTFAGIIGTGIAKGCPPIENKDPLSYYSRALLYGGGQRNDKLRFDGTTRLYRQEKFDEIIFAGTAEDQKIFVELNQSTGMPYQLAQLSRYTAEEVKNAFKLVQVEEPVLHISGEEQMERIAYIVEKRGFDPHKNDGFAGVKDNYTGAKARLREHIACEAAKYGKDSWLKWIEDHIPFYKGQTS